MKKLINTIKLLTIAINDLRKSICELNDSLNNQKPKYQKKNPTENNSFTNKYETYSSSYYSEKQAIERVCKAFSEGPDTDDYKKIIVRLKKDWPNLYSALINLTIYKINSKSTTVSYDPFKNYDK
jgi:hypothetical protein